MRAKAAQKILCKGKSHKKSRKIEAQECKKTLQERKMKKISFFSTIISIYLPFLFSFVGKNLIEIENNFDQILHFFRFFQHACILHPVSYSC